MEMYPGYTFAVGQSEAGIAMQTQKLAIFVWTNSMAVRTFGAVNRLIHEKP